MKNFFNPGEYVVPIPIGIPIKLQYNSKGHLESVFINSGEKCEDASKGLRDPFLSHHTCPPTISIKQGTTWVYGVLHSFETFARPGQIPTCIIPDIIESYLRHPESFKFYAYTVDSLAIKFKGAAPIRQWLTLAKFDVLPGWVVSANSNKDKFDDMVRRSKYHFDPARIMRYAVFSDGDMHEISVNLAQMHCKSVQMDADYNGYLYGVLICDNGTKNNVSIRLPYTQIANQGVRNNSNVLIENDATLHWCNTSHTHKHNRITCPYCGRSILLPINGNTICSNYHCKSRLFSRYLHFCNILNLPILEYSEFSTLVQSNELTSMFDIFDLPLYKDQRIDADISLLLKSLVPLDVVSDTSVIDKFVNHCNNSLDTVMYYLNHLDKICIDFDLNPMQIRGLVSWFTDAENVLELYTVSKLSNIHINRVIRKFDGPPIFRNKIISLTGTFRHGTHDEVSAIIRSYAGSVQAFNNNIDCLLVGDIRDGINGQWIQFCTQNNIPVIEEHKFFTMYEIDEDIAHNLV